MPTSERQIFSVSELTRRIRATLERTFGAVWIEGELSNVRQPASGHYYFTLKDESAQISGVLFRGNQRDLKFKPVDGLLVRAYGEISVYERGGNYQVIVRQMEEGGKGSLQARFEALKEKLKQEGLFDEARKRPLPLLPRHVGVVTSPTGAAIRDILNVITRRFPNLHVVLAPVKVQGETAAGEIAAAIDLLNERGGLDVMIVGRGGGSLEDLWCFNEEVVARAIARSRIPVISAVGHEIDFTISDFVADLRAPTPSAAAELVVGRKDAFEERIGVLSQGLRRSLREAVMTARHRVEQARASYVFREPGNLVKQYQQRLDGCDVRLGHAIRERRAAVRQRLDAVSLRLAHGVQRVGVRIRQRVDDYALRMQHAVKRKQDNAGQDVRRLSMQLQALSPLNVLGRGYSITMDEQGRALHSSEDIAVGQVVRTRLGKGGFEAEITRTGTSGG